MPTVSRDGPGLVVDGLHDGPHGIGRGEAWRAVLADVAAAATHPIWDPNYYDLFPEGEWGPLRAVGWSS